MENTRRSDLRELERIRKVVDAAVRERLEAFKADTTASFAQVQGHLVEMVADLSIASAALEALVAEQTGIIAQQAAMLADLQARQPVVLGQRTFSVGSLVSLTLAGVKKTTIGLAGVKPTDILACRLITDTPADYGLPQLACLFAGQVKVAIAVPQLAIGTQANITIEVSALR